MQMKLNKWMLMGLLASLLTACAGVSAPKTAEEQVAARAQARMDALVAKDFAAVHGFFSPAYRRQLPFEAWVGSKLPRADFVRGRVLQVNCLSAEACDVELESVYRAPQGVRAAPKGEIERVVPQRWIQLDGQWWLFQR